MKFLHPMSGPKLYKKTPRDTSSLCIQAIPCGLIILELRGRHALRGARPGRLRAPGPGWRRTWLWYDLKKWYAGSRERKRCYAFWHVNHLQTMHFSLPASFAGECSRLWENQNCRRGNNNSRLMSHRRRMAILFTASTLAIVYRWFTSGQYNRHEFQSMFHCHVTGECVLSLLSPAFHIGQMPKTCHGFIQAINHFIHSTKLHWNHPIMSINISITQFYSMSMSQQYPPIFLCFNQHKNPTSGLSPRLLRSALRGPRGRPGPHG